MVVGMGVEAHRDPEDVVSLEHPYVRELVDTVSRLKDALHREGEVGLGRHQEMSRLEANLRAYCEGCLTGQRAERALSSMIEEPPPTEG